MKICFVKPFGMYAVGDVIDPPIAGVASEFIRRGFCVAVAGSREPDAKALDGPYSHKMVERATVNRKGDHGR